MRVVALVLPRLPIQVLRTGRPDLLGKPLGLLAGDGDGALLSAVSVEATADGVEPGMTALQARQRCPGILLERDNAAACIAQLEALVSILQARTTTTVAIVSRNAVAVSLEGLESRFSDEGAAAHGILTLARSWSGLDVRGAVAGDVQAAICAASKARRFPAIVPGGENPEAASLPVYAPVTASFAFAAPASADIARARLARMLGALRPVVAELGQSYRHVRVELAHGPFRTAYVLRCATPIHDPAEALDVVRARLSAELEGITELRVTLGAPGPSVEVEPWRQPVATVHELSAPAVPVQRRLLRAS